MDDAKDDVRENTKKIYTDKLTKNECKKLTQDWRKEKP